MKKFSLIFIVLLFISCTAEVNENNQMIQKMEFSTKNFIGSTIAFEDNKGIVSLGVSKEDLISAFNIYSQKNELGITTKSFEIFNLDSKNYIRFYNDDESVSTIALIKNDMQSKKVATTIYSLGSTVCTSTECANCCGCIPNGAYCTRCEIRLTDCKRTTTGGSNQ